MSIHDSTTIDKSCKYKRRIWVTWESQRRNKTLSKKLNAKYYEIISSEIRLLKYPVNIIITIYIYFKEKPHLVFVQNPSIILSLMTILFGKLVNVPIIIDAHNAGVYPLDGRSNLLKYLAIYLFRNAALTIVSNTYLADYVNQFKGKAVILPDPLPEFTQSYKAEIVDHKRRTVVFICTWASDEPYIEVIKAALYIDKSITIYITGNSKGKEKNAGIDMPDNIILTGFISENEYISLLCTSDIIIDLTTRDNCLVCGAYEGVELEKPLILSNKRALKEYFYKGAIFTDNNSHDIAKSIDFAFSKIKLLRNEILELKKLIKQEWKIYLNNLETELNNLS